jgi:acid phosphatase
MRRIIASLTVVVALAAASAAHAQQGAPGLAPAPVPVTTALGKQPIVELSDGGAGLPYLGSATSYNAGDLKAALRGYHDSGIYAAQLAQIDALATKWLKAELADRKIAARKHASRARTKARKLHGRNWWKGKPAIVLDIDETSLSNWTAIAGDGFVYGPLSQAEATNQTGVAIKPTLDLYELAQSKGVAAFFITGRGEAQRAVTTTNLDREGYTHPTELVLKPAGYTGTTDAYKSGARASIERRGYHIVENIGDQYSDLSYGHADLGFKLPNPFYYLP